MGLNTNVQFLDDLAGSDGFIQGLVHTGFIQQHHDELFPKRTVSDELLCQAAIGLVLLEKKRLTDTAALPRFGTISSGSK